VFSGDRQRKINLNAAVVYAAAWWLEKSHPFQRSAQNGSRMAEEPRGVIPSPHDFS